MLALALIAAHPAKAVDFTLSDSAILSLDYDNSAVYVPPLTATITSEQDISGTGVQFNIHYTSTNWPDYIRFQLSDSTYGAGTLAGLNVGAYSNFVLKFTVLSIDGSSSGIEWLEAGAVIGPYNGYPNAYNPQFVSLTGSLPSSVISSIPVTFPTISTIGFNAELYPYGGWSMGPHDITLLVQPAPGAVQIPEPTTWAMVTLGASAFFGRRRLRRLSA
jgi:hypothetical protein